MSDNKKETTEKVVTTPRAFKSVKNRNMYKVELVINDRVVVFPPGKSVSVPENASIPEGLGLYIR